MDRKTLAAAFPYTVPVLMGYLSIGIVFGWMMSSIGYNPLWSVAMSATIYAGSGQYLGVDLLKNATPLADVAFLTLVINFRHLVYGLSMLEKFKGMGWRKLYMIFPSRMKPMPCWRGCVLRTAWMKRNFILPLPFWTRRTGSPGRWQGPWPAHSSPSIPRALILP